MILLANRKRLLDWHDHKIIDRGMFEGIEWVCYNKQSIGRFFGIKYYRYDYKYMKNNKWRHDFLISDTDSYMLTSLAIDLTYMTDY